MDEAQLPAIQGGQAAAPGGAASSRADRPVPAYPIDPSSESDIRYYWRVFWARRWLLPAAASIGFGIAALATLWQPRLYQAQATVEFKQALPPGKDIEIVNREVFIPPALAARLLTTKLLAARVIRGERERGRTWLDPGSGSTGEGRSGISSGIRDAIGGALGKLRIAAGRRAQEDDNKREAEADADWVGVDLATINRYYGHISVRPVPMTSLADIVATHEDPRIAAELANDHAEAFIEMDVETKTASLSDAHSLFQQQLVEVRGKLETSRRGLSDYQREHGILSLPKDNTTITRESLQQLNKLLTESQGERIVAEANYRNASSMSAEDLAKTLPDQTLQVLREELLGMRAKYEAQLREYGRNHPDMLALQARIDSLGERLRASGEQARVRLRATFDAAQAKESELRENFKSLSRAATEEDRQLVQLLILQRDVEGNQELYTNLLQQAKAADLASGGFRWTNVKLVDRAVVPDLAAYPRTRRNLLLGLLLGLGCGATLCIALDRLDNRIHTPDHVATALRLPAFGVVPDFNRLAERAVGRPLIPPEQAANAGRELVTLLHPASVVSEAYRGIRTNLMFSHPGRPPQTVLVTSSQPGEGKTVTTINLAVSLALSGAKVLVIDADLRKPGCHVPLRAAREPGLSNVLTGQCELSAAVVRPTVFGNGDTKGGNGRGLYLLPAGPPAPNPAELLGSPVMAAVLDSLRSEFEFILLDSAPVLPVSDSVVIATKTDGVLMVVRGGEWSRDIVQRALGHLGAVRARVLGVVLNRVDVQRSGSPYYHYHRGYYASYYGEAPDAGPGQT